ncbi:triple block protein 1 [Potato virus P]|uniref:Triple block protein 1 n=2 Tax=Potato virus P TaxID=329164 RepID=Q4U0G4_9VIRU|nr:triple block protein 1 [Potato virus P]AAY53915.2 triple block protein 1 [Potato rough dwarf virus]ABD23960.1 triple gene block protein 1 [Potato virus P]
MDILVKVLLECGFTRIRSNLDLPIVVHSVPGAGKSTVIRKLIGSDRRFKAVTFGEPDTVNLLGSYIRGAEAIPDCQFLLVDEYLSGRWIESAFAVFADPLQGGTGEVREAHFINSTSKRFGKTTAQLLRSLEFDIQAEGEDSVQISDIFKVEPRDQIIFYEEEVGRLLRAHGLECRCIEEVRGKTFESVTFVTGENSPPSKDRAKVFQGLTRHRKHLLILCPDATYTTS